MAKNKLSEFSRHIFWEYDINGINWKDHEDFIIIRVLEYGNDSDWILLKKSCSKEEIKKAGIGVRSLDDVTMHFIAQYTDTPLSEFRCYKNKQLIPHFSGY